MDYTGLLDLGLQFLVGWLGGLKSKAPAEVVASVQAAIDAVTAHKNDVISKANLEANRS